MHMTEILAIDNLQSFYGDFQALHGVSLSLDQGNVMALIGANGAGKSTLLKSICGMVSVRAGSVRWKGADLRGQSPNHIVRAGIAMVPEGRRLFPSLSVEENLIIGGQVARKGPWSLRAVYDLFPILAEKKSLPATSLSGGQQQMVSIGRALMSNPDLILLDELSLGLAPIVIKDIYAQLPRITASGMSAILVEQDVTRALSAAAKFICLQEGRVSLQGLPGAHSRDAISAAYFGT
jgi:branched-chain amino acid transport system ATP-binding protein